MEQLARTGDFSPPELSSLEEIAEFGIGLRRGRVFVDLWDVEQFAACEACVSDRKQRLQRMNLEQRDIERVACDCCVA